MVDAGSYGLLAPGAGQAALALRRVGHQADAGVGAHGHQLRFVLAAQQVVLVLHGHEPGPAALVGGVLQLGELPGVHRRCAEVANLARLEDVMQGLHRLGGRGGRVEAVDLVQVDIVGAEPGQGGVDLLNDRFAGQAGSAGTLVHLAEHLGGQHDVLATRIAPDRAADDFFRRASLIGVRGVPEGDTELDGLPEERLRLVVGQCPPVSSFGRGVAVAHAAQREPADPQPGVTELGVLHLMVPSLWEC